MTQSCKEVILLRDCIRVWFFLLVWTHFLGHLLGLKVTELWQLCKSFFWQVLMPNIGVKLKTNGFGSQLESCKKYPLAMGSLFEYFFFFSFFLCILLYFMWWEVLWKLLILDFLMEKKFLWESYLQMKVWFKIRMMSLLRNFYMERYFKICERI